MMKHTNKRRNRISVSLLVAMLALGAYSTSVRVGGATTARQVSWQDVHHR